MSAEQPRPRLSRYDRPALSLAELLRGEGTDFICQAVWTMRGRRVHREEHDRLLALLDAPSGKLAVLDHLDQTTEPGSAPVALAGLGQVLLVERRRNTPVVGPVLAGATCLAHRFPVLGMPVRFVRSIPGKVRWTYRHTRKFAVRLAGRAGLPSRVEVRRTLGVRHEPAAPGMSDRAAAIYRQLCIAVDQSGAAL